MSAASDDVVQVIFTVLVPVKPYKNFQKFVTSFMELT